jgi:hypothetical protein
MLLKKLGNTLGVNVIPIIIQNKAFVSFSIMVIKALTQSQNHA